MTVAETTLDAAQANYLSSIAETISSPTATHTTASKTIPNGAWAVVLGIWSGSDPSDNLTVSDSGSHTWTPIHSYDTTSKFALFGWYNNTGSSVSMTITFTWHFVNNGPAGTWIGAITGTSSTTPSVRATLTNASTVQASATPSQLNSLMCVHYAQWAPTADISSLVAGSATDSSPVGHAYFSGGPGSIGTIYQTTPNSQTASPVTVGASAPTSAQTYGVLVEYFAPGGTNYTGAPADSEGITDSASQVQAMARTQADAVGITDSASASLGHVQQVADPVGITDAPSTAIGYVRQQSDPLGITDAATVTQSGSRSVADPVGLTDAANAQQSITRAPADPIGITDSASSLQGLARPPADPAGITDTAAATQSMARTQDDPVGITDSVSAVLIHNYVATIADSIGITDLDSPQAIDYSTPVDDSVGITDSVSAVLTGSGEAIIGEPVNLTDQVTSQLGMARAATDQVGLLDAASASVGFLKSVAEPIGLTDTTTAQQALLRAQGDAVPVTDSVALGRALPMGDATALSDQVSASLGMGRSADDQLGLDDAAWAVLDLQRAVDEAVGITDSVSAVLTPLGFDYVVDLDEALGITDSVVAVLTRAPVMQGAGWHDVVNGRLIPRNTTPAQPDVPVWRDDINVESLIPGEEFE